MFFIDRIETLKEKDFSQNKIFLTEEKKLLINSLIELHNDGKFKAEGDFKVGHLKALKKNYMMIA